MDNIKGWVGLKNLPVFIQSSNNSDIEIIRFMRFQYGIIELQKDFLKGLQQA